MEVQPKLTVALVLLTLAGCASSARLPPAAEAPSADESPPTQARAAEPATFADVGGHGGRPCPTDLHGTSVFATPLEDGAAMLFIAPPGPKVDELRRRVRSLARAPSPAYAPIAAVDDIDSGARLKLTPRWPEGLDDVRRNVFEYAQRLAGPTCPLVRDELDQSGRMVAGPESTIPPVPPGIIPGIGGMAGPTAVPAIGPTF